MPNEVKTIKLQSKVISLGEDNSNDMYMQLSMVFLTSQVNLNNIKFTEEFINNIATNSETYVGIPLLADISMLESGQYNKLTHKYDKQTNTFGTIGIGSFVKFSTRQNGDILELLADCRVWKRNIKTCEALVDLYNSDSGLSFSYEILVGNSTEENGIIIVSEDPSNNPIGSCVVSFPAVPESKAELLVAELLNESINIMEGGNVVAKKRDNTITCEEAFAETRIHLSTQIAELDSSQINRKIWNALRVMFPNDFWDWDITDRYPDYIVIQNYDTGDYFQVDFIVTETDVTLSEKVPVSKTYVKIQTNNEEGNTVTIAEMESKLAEVNANLKLKETELASINEKLQAKDAELTKVNENLTTISAAVIEKDKSITDLSEIKTKYDAIIAENEVKENEIKKTALKDKYGKLLSAEVLSKPEIAEAIDKLNEAVLDKAVVEIALATATKPNTKETLTASRITDSVSIGNKDLVSKYVTIQE